MADISSEEILVVQGFIYLCMKHVHGFTEYKTANSFNYFVPIKAKGKHKVFFYGGNIMIFLFV
jgi:hypothetical protein